MSYLNILIDAVAKVLSAEFVGSIPAWDMLVIISIHVSDPYTQVNIILVGTAS